MSKLSAEPEIATSDFPEEQPHLMEQVVGPLFEDDAFTVDSEDSVDEILAPFGCRCIEVEFGLELSGRSGGATCWEQALWGSWNPERVRAGSVDIETGRVQLLEGAQALPPVPDVKGMVRQSRPLTWTPTSAGWSLPGAGFPVESEIAPSDFRRSSHTVWNRRSALSSRRTPSRLSSKDYEEILAPIGCRCIDV